MRSAKAPPGTNIILGGLWSSFGLFRSNTGVSIGNEKLNLFVNYGHQQATGFRDTIKPKKILHLLTETSMWITGIRYHFSVTTQTFIMHWPVNRIVQPFK